MQTSEGSFCRGAGVNRSAPHTLVKPSLRALALRCVRVLPSKEVPEDKQQGAWG